MDKQFLFLHALSLASLLLESLLSIQHYKNQNTQAFLENNKFPKQKKEHSFVGFWSGLNDFIFSQLTYKEKRLVCSGITCAARSFNSMFLMTLFREPTVPQSHGSLEN